MNRANEVNEVMRFFYSYIEKQPLTKVQLEALKKKGQEVFESYFPIMQEWPEKVESEVKISGVGIEPDIKLTGKLDMIMPVGSSEFKVYDFKTGKPKSRNWIEGKNKNTTGDYKRQLVFYKILMNAHLGGVRKMVEGVIEFVQPTDSGQFKSESFVITPEETQELESVIVTVANEIRNLEFWNRRCDDEECEYCELRDMMG